MSGSSTKGSNWWSSGGKESDFFRLMICSRISVISSCTRVCIFILTPSGVHPGTRHPEWILPWYSEINIRAPLLSLRKSKYCSQSQQMRLETPILIGDNVGPDLIAFSARVNSQWSDVVTVALFVVATMISGYLVLTSSSVTCSSSCFSASSLSKVQTLFGICTVWWIGGVTYEELLVICGSRPNWVLTSVNVRTGSSFLYSGILSSLLISITAPQ